MSYFGLNLFGVLLEFPHVASMSAQLSFLELGSITTQYIVSFVKIHPFQYSLIFGKFQSESVESREVNENVRFRKSIAHFFFFGYAFQLKADIMTET